MYPVWCGVLCGIELSMQISVAPNPGNRQIWDADNPLPQRVISHPNR